MRRGDCYMNKIKVLTIGGGSGQYALLSGMRDMEELEITAVVSMMDSGGSTGKLRDEFGILPPGDVLKCILALSPYTDMARTILLRRFQHNPRLEGHNAGNLLLTMLSQYAGNFPAGILALAEILDVKGTILPVTINRATLVAELTDGSHVYGEKAIDMPRGTQREKIRKVFLVPHHSETISVYPAVIQAIDSADLILLGPGDLFTSIIANLIVPGVHEAIQASQAKVLFIMNLMTKFGETHHYSCRDFIEKLEESLGREVDGIVYNTGRPAADFLKAYRNQKAELVALDEDISWISPRRLFTSDMLAIAGGVLRHDPIKLAAVIRQAVDDFFWPEVSIPPTDTES